MKILINIVLLLVLFTSPILCQTYNLDDTKKIKIDAKVNEEITLIVETNSSTGYNWYINLDSTNNKVKLIYEKDIPFFHTIIRGLVGASSKKIYKLKPLEKGQYIITLAYKRHWEQLPPIDKKTIILNIRY